MPSTRRVRQNARTGDQIAPDTSSPLSAALRRAPAAPVPRAGLETVWPAENDPRHCAFLGGSTIDISRIVLDLLSRQLGQTIVVEGRAAPGSLGSAAVAKANPILH